jgi:hypothetical protein
MSRNSVTGDHLISRTPTDEYRAGFDRIFAKPVVCQRCGEVNPAEIHTCTPKDSHGEVQP